MDKNRIEELKKSSFERIKKEIGLTISYEEAEAEIKQKNQEKVRNSFCSVCYQKFTEKNIKQNSFIHQTSHTDYYYPIGCQTEITYYHPECFAKLEVEKKNNPLLFAKVERLEQELEQIKKRVER